MQCKAGFRTREAGPQGYIRRYRPPLAESSIFRRAAPDKRFVSGRWLDLGWMRLERMASEQHRGEKVTLKVVFGLLSELGQYMEQRPGPRST